MCATSAGVPGKAVYRRSELLAEPSAWPPPLPAAAPGTRIEIPVDGMADVVGESDVRWINASSGTELLIVDQLVNQPEHASWVFEGELAR